MGKKKAERGLPVTLGDLLMNATVNGQKVEVTTGALLHGAMADTFKANVTAIEGELGWDTESERIEAIAKIAARKKQEQIASNNRYARRAPVTGAYGEEGYKPSKGTKITVVTTPANKVTKTGEIVKNDVSKKPTQVEFDGTKSKHDKLYERKSSGKFVINCAAARTYRQQAWNHFNWRKAGLSEQPEHPDVTAVQLAAI